MIAHGCVKTDEEVLLEDVVFHITQKRSSGPKLGSWFGHFTISMGDREGALKAINICNLDGPFHLVLLDGTSGRIHPMLPDVEEKKVTVKFKGSGGLETNAK